MLFGTESVVLGRESIRKKNDSELALHTVRVALILN